MEVGLNKISQKEKSPRIHRTFFKWCHADTCISVLTSMILIYHIHKAVCNDNGGTVKSFAANEEQIINDWSVSKWEFQSIFRLACPYSDWSSRLGMINAFNALIYQYLENAQINLNTWAKARMKNFLRMKQYELNQTLRMQGMENNDQINWVDAKFAVTALMYQYYYGQNKWPPFYAVKIFALGSKFNLVFMLENGCICFHKCSLSRWSVRSIYNFRWK